MKLLNKIVLFTLIFTMCISTTTYASSTLPPDSICAPLDYNDDAGIIDEIL